MIMKIRERILRATAHKDKEAGDSVVTSLFMIPFAIFLLFAMVNMSMYFQARGQVQNIARDGARQVALYGGNSRDVPRNDRGTDVSQIVYNKLYSGGNCTISGCTKPPVVTCGPNISNSAGSDVYCEVTYFFNPVANDIFGFGNITAQQFKVRETYVSETGY